MTLPELQRAIYQLSVEEQFVLLETLVQALKVKHLLIGRISASIGLLQPSPAPNSGGGR